MDSTSPINPDSSEPAEANPKIISQLKAVILGLVVLLLLVSGVFGYLILQQKSSSDVQVSTAPTISPSVGSENSKLSINWTNKLLLSKDYGKIKIGAYSVDDLLGDVFIVAPIENGGPTNYSGAYALSFASNAFAKDNLFDIVGDKIYVLNQSRSFIDIYAAGFSEKTLATPAYYEMNYVGSIGSPGYKVGVPYSIKCQNDLCQLKTAFHQESGCDMTLNLKTKQYSGIKCSSMGGDFSPEPL